MNAAMHQHYMIIICTRAKLAIYDYVTHLSIAAINLCTVALHEKLEINQVRICDFLGHPHIFFIRKCNSSLGGLSAICHCNVPAKDSREEEGLEIRSGVKC